MEEPFINRFEGLEMNELSPDEVSGGGAGEVDSASQRGAQRKNKNGKGKKGPTAQVPKFQDWPLEDFGIKDDPGSETEATFAAFCFLQDRMKLRRYTADLWRQVVKERLHSAIAGAPSNVAVARVKQSQHDPEDHWHIGDFQIGLKRP